MILNYSHIAIAVTDMDAALDFYCEVLGMSVSADWMQELKAEKSGEITGGRDIKRRCVWLRWSGIGGSQPGLALDQMFSPEPPDHRAELFDLGVNHIAFWVDNIDEIMERARANDYEVLRPHEAKSADYGEPEGSTIRSVFLRDPDRNIIQCDMRIS
jgi:catechol 2,3-dioxygenase-like lactoylglutathione lyase family enzyme